MDNQTRQTLRRMATASELTAQAAIQAADALTQAANAVILAQGASQPQIPTPGDEPTVMEQPEVPDDAHLVAWLASDTATSTADVCGSR